MKGNSAASLVAGWGDSAWCEQQLPRGLEVGHESNDSIDRCPLSGSTCRRDHKTRLLKGRHNCARGARRSAKGRHNRARGARCSAKGRHNRARGARRSAHQCPLPPCRALRGCIYTRNDDLCQAGGRRRTRPLLGHRLVVRPLPGTRQPIFPLWLQRSALPCSFLRNRFMIV